MCDCCGATHAPTAIAGKSSDGWEKLYDMDLCYICYHLMMKDIINKTPEETIKKVIKEISKQWKVDTNFLMNT